MKVVLGVIVDQKNRVLVTQRPLHVAHGGCWEFPGGKIEVNESPEEALSRELQEELGIQIQDFKHLGQINHVYPEYQVALFIYQISCFTGEPACLAGQQNMKWVAKEELNPEEFPKANEAIFEWILKD